MCVAQVQSFQSLVNYLLRFIPNLATLCKPLQDLCKSNVLLTEQALQNIKNAITDDVRLQFHDESLPLIIELDASSLGLGSAMLQPDNDKDGELTLIYFHSKMLSDTEKNYPNIDRELLGVVHAVEKFSNFTTGHKTIIHTDHRPLLALFQKNIMNASPRLVRLLLRVSHYNLELVYKKGKEMYISDPLSRMPNHKVDNGKMIPGLNVSIHEVYNNVDISKNYMLTIKEDTGDDHILQQLINVI